MVLTFSERWARFGVSIQEQEFPLLYQQEFYLALFFPLVFFGSSDFDAVFSLVLLS